ncbi:hypothetical protein DFJ73DRAFT_802443 [Zopfochytrium polystomum]|nr:hypothetical protein DFJ73DRAFT_802443 [Zopfochytrium polystomum]
MVPCHIIFTMPWSPTTAFSNPLTNIPLHGHTFAPTSWWTFLTWEGLGDIVNNFRKSTLGLAKLSPKGGPTIMKVLEVPHTYIWSEALIPKPADWGAHIGGSAAEMVPLSQSLSDITGFIFLDLASAYTPPQDLVDFLAAGPPPVYIGFGSIVVDDPDALTATIFEAIKIANVRAIVSKGWGGLGGAGKDVPDGVYMIGNCPHDWLFKQVSAVVHHGGAGTTSAGLKAGKPTVVVPFFGDQSFWGAMIASIQAGPPPIPFKKLTADRLASAIQFCFAPAVVQAAALAGARITAENGAAATARSFHAHLPLDAMRCDVDPHRTARWYLPTLGKKVSDDALAALTARSGGEAPATRAAPLPPLGNRRPRPRQSQRHPLPPLAVAESPPPPEPSSTRPSRTPAPRSRQHRPLLRPSSSSSSAAPGYWTARIGEALANTTNHQRTGDDTLSPNICKPPRPAAAVGASRDPHQSPPAHDHALPRSASAPIETALAAPAAAPRFAARLAAQMGASVARAGRYVEANATAKATRRMGTHRRATARARPIRRRQCRR